MITCRDDNGQLVGIASWFIENNNGERVVRTVEPHDSVERYSALGVECIEGTAKITSPWSVEIATAQGTQTLSTRAIVIAAGARPFVPLTSMPNQVYISRGLIGQPVVYVPGQPIRNGLRYILP